MPAFPSDLKAAARRLARSPGFTAAAVATLGLGLGAAVAILALVDAIVLRPLPYPAAERLVRVEHPVPGENPDWVWRLSQAGYQHFRDHGRSLAGIGVYSSGEVTVAGERGAERVDGAFVSATLLEVLGARAVLGRTLLAADDHRGAAPVAVIGHDYWLRRFGGDSGIVGRTMRIDEEPVEIVGVMAPGVHLPDERVALWLALRLDPAAPPVNSHWLTSVARLRDGVTPQEAEAELARMTATFPQLFPSAYSPTFMRTTRFSVRVTPLRDAVLGDVARVLWILLGSVAVVLLIACANVANLFLVRGELRRRELAVRAALGASGAQLARHSLTESLLLAAAGGVVGLWLAYEALGLLLALAPAGIPRLAEARLGARAAAACALAVLAAGVTFGLLPLLRAPGALGTLRQGGRGASAPHQRHGARGVLVAGQVALALVLLAAAGLMLRSAANLRAVSPGFEPRGVLALDLSLPAPRYGDYESVARFHRELARRVEALPGVTSTGVAPTLPLAGDPMCALVWVEGRPVSPGEAPPCVGVQQVGPGYFRTLGIAVRGRAPSWDDTERRAGEVVVSRALAERLWPGEDPIGKGVRGNGPTGPYYRVVGVAGDVHAERLDEPPLEAVYFPLLPLDGAPLWMPPRAVSLVVRSASGSPTDLAPAVRRIVAELDPGVATADARTMSTIVARSMSRVTFTLVLLAIAAGMALVLSAVGLYGTIAYAVSRRVNEIGIRMALGAQAAQVAGLVVGQALRIVGVGVAVGLVGALAVTRVLRAILFGVSPADPPTLVGAALVLVAVAVLAAWLPARRAARVDPMVALRAE